MASITDLYLFAISDLQQWLVDGKWSVVGSGCVWYQFVWMWEVGGGCGADEKSSAPHRVNRRERMALGRQ